MRSKIFLAIVFFWCLSYSQDSLSTMSIDTTIKTDTITIHDTVTLPAEKCQYLLKAEQKLKINSIFNMARNTKDSIVRRKINKTADSALKIWSDIYPEEARYLRQKSILMCSGIAQIAFGALGILFAAIDPGSEKSFTSEVPSAINSKGIVTATKKQTIKYTTGWQPYHTGLLILSSGIIISGIITVNF